MITRGVILEGWWAEAEIRRLLEYLRAGDTVVDVGANVGLHALRFARAVGPDGFVLAFEPEPLNFSLLQRNVEGNGLSQVQAEPVALLDRVGHFALHLSHANKGAHSIGMGGVRDRDGQVQVRSIPLDAYLDTHLARRTVRLIKMDVQGSESRVLEGARSLLERDHPILLVEYCPFLIQQAGGSAPDLVSFLVGLGYRLHILGDGGVREARPEVLRSQVPEVEVNLLAFPGQIEIGVQQFSLGTIL